MAIKRRDMLDGSRLLARNGLTKPGEMDNPTALMMAVSYLTEKREGKTDVPFQEWLDGDFEESNLTGDDADDDGEGPTEEE